MEIVLWLVAVGVAAVDLRRRRSEHPPTRDRPARMVRAHGAGVGAGPAAPAASGGLGAEDLKGEEVWIDV